MRIAMFSWETMHSIHVGGVAAHVSELSDALARRGHEVHVFTRMGEGQPPHSIESGVHYHRCPFELDSNFIAEINNMCDSFAWHMNEVVRKTGPFDLVHGHDWLASKALVQARNDHNAACVFTIHSTEYGRCGNQNHDGDSRTIRDMEWEGGFCSDITIAVSGVVGREYRNLYQMPQEKVIPIYNGVHAERFGGAIDVKHERAKHDVGCYDPMVLFAGRLAWQKGPDVLVESIPEILSVHPGAKFVFAGDGGMRSGLQARVGDLGVSHAVRFAGYRRGDELTNLFKATDMVCVPSRNEPFGIVILEAWAAGKPVVVTHNGGPAEFVNHGSDGLKVYDHAESVRWGIIETFRNFEHARKMGAAGQRRARTEFSWDAIATETEKAYDQALANNRRRLGLGENIELDAHPTLDLAKPKVKAA